MQKGHTSVQCHWCESCKSVIPSGILSTIYTLNWDESSILLLSHAHNMLEYCVRFTLLCWVTKTWPLCKKWPLSWPKCLFHFSTRVMRLDLHKIVHEFKGDDISKMPLETRFGVANCRHLKNKRTWRPGSFTHAYSSTLTKFHRTIPGNRWSGKFTIRYWVLSMTRKWASWIG